MDINALQELAQKMMENRKAHLEREKGFTYYHGLRVSKVAINLRKIVLPEDSLYDEILITASLFHDVAKGIEPHGTYGSVLVKEILKDYCTEEEIDKISELIYHHSLRKMDKNYSDYIKIIQDADILDHFGSIEMWINFQYYAHTDEPMHKSIEFYDNEFDDEVQRLRGLLNYDVSRKIFDDKISFVHSFVNRFKKEVAGEFCIEV